MRMAKRRAVIMGATMRNEGRESNGVRERDVVAYGSTVDGEDDLSPSQELGSLGSMLLALARTDSVALAPGTLIADQYRIARTIGEGGMGVVFLAHDVRLGRDVAMKLCTGLSASAVHRIQREAMALAKLAHPNVVVVFQAGELDGRFFIAMEHVAGGTARSWLAAAPRRPREIVALYVAAGEGLAAAHAAGLVHRDFKPDNVLVGEDGRPRVADFGLVRAADERARVEELEVASAVRATGATLVTKAGTVMGTPAYMPPEQLAGAELDARADQYAFAASLWEALMGWRATVDGAPLAGKSGAAWPGASRGSFAGESASAVRASVASERPRAAGEVVGEVPPDVPRHVVAALRRALAERPEDRWPDLATLLAELRRDPAATRRRMALGAVALALTATVTGVAVAMTRDDGPPPCEDGAARIEALWSAERRTALAEAVGEAAWPAIEARVQPRADAWVDAYTQACRATLVDAVADEATLHRRMLCLEQRSDELRATLAALGTGSRTAVSNAVEALDLLPDSAACLDVDAVASGPPLPSDPVLRVRIAEAQRAVAEVSVTRLDRDSLDADAQAERAVTLARATGWAPIIANALIERAGIASDDDRNRDAVADYEDALHLALGSGSELHALYALTGMAWPLGSLDRTAEAAQALRVARGIWERLGRPRFEEKLLLGAEAHVALHDLRPRDAVAKTREQIALTDPDVPATILAGDQFNLALALEQADLLEEAMEATMRAIALSSEALGEDHPMTARYRGLASKIALGRGDLAAAEALARRAVDTMEQWFGPDHSSLTQPLDVLAEVLRRQGRHDESLVLRHRNLELRRRLDPDSSDVTKMETNLAIAMIDHGRLVQAAPMAARSLARLERHHRHDHPDLVQALVLTGYIARERPDPDLAASRRDLDRALAIADARLGPDHAETVNTELELAKTLVAAGAAADAVERLERRLEAPPEDLPRDKLAEVRYMLARALAATGRTKQACTLAGQVEAMQVVILNVEPVSEWRARHCDAKRRSVGH
jgi:serine/threonine protein kinase